MISLQAGECECVGKLPHCLNWGQGLTGINRARERLYEWRMLGRSRKEIAERVDRIVDFAGVREFIDTPIRTFSSGMMARLGFAVATDVDADILIVDEILSVGDKDFQQKSFERMRALMEHGTTVLFVSHDTETVKRICQRAVWLENGRIKMLGKADDVVGLYPVTWE